MQTFRVILASIKRLVPILALAFSIAGGRLEAIDHVVVNREGKQSTISGKVIVAAEDGGVMLMSPDGVLWNIPPEELVDRTTDEDPFVPLNADELKRKLLAELPAGFEVHATAHYLIFYNTSQAYAQWCGSLFERLYTAFTNFWSRRGLKLYEPVMPMVVVVFADQPSYVSFANAELGSNAKQIVGYYSLRSNRVTMHDLTGTEAARGAIGRRGNMAQINQMLARPEAESMVATVVHEATHQIAFNCGLHKRFADIPLWLSEGLAVYFEQPDLKSAKGWRTIGDVNRSRLVQFQAYLPNRPADSLKTLIADDKRFRDPKQVLDAYAEAWALTYYLMRQSPKKYQSYLEQLAAKDPLVWDDPGERIRLFTECFGDLETVDNEFLRYLARVR